MLQSFRFYKLAPLEHRAAMGAAGRHKVEQKYTWELAAERLEGIYRQVLEEG